MNDTNPTDTPESDSSPKNSLESEKSDQSKDDDDSSLAKLKKLDKWWSLLILLFGFTGVLGIPLLWLSQSFNVPLKILITILVTAWTGALAWMVFLEAKWVYSEILKTIE